MREARAFLFHDGRRGMRVQLQGACNQQFAQRVACIATDAQETEGHQLAVIGHARGRLEHAQLGGLVGSWATKLLGGYRAP